MDEPWANRNIDAVAAHGSNSSSFVRGSMGVAARTGCLALAEADRCRGGYPVDMANAGAIDCPGVAFSSSHEMPARQSCVSVKRRRRGDAGMLFLFRVASQGGGSRLWQSSFRKREVVRRKRNGGRLLGVRIPFLGRCRCLQLNVAAKGGSRGLRQRFVM